MKVVKKAIDKKEKVKKNGGVAKPKSKKEQVLVVAQEIKYARLLSGNEKKTRDRVLKALKKWLLNCFEKGYEFKEDDFTRVWKGLFYAVWMSDKPLIQEELCENISSILDLFTAEQLTAALLMVKAGFQTLATEWYGIDHHRMDKFLMLVRRYLRGSLRCLQRCEWSLRSCQEYAALLSGADGLLATKTPHYARNALSMLLHFTDCFLEELAKVSGGAIPGASVAALLAPFVQYTCGGELPALLAAARRLLTALLRQSALGVQYEDKTRAWKQMGCPEGGPDALEPMSDDEEEPVWGDGDAESDEDDSGAQPLDPRAGRVDVELPLLPVPASLIADMLADTLGRAGSKAHKRLKICLQRFQTLARGQYPLPLQLPAAETDEVAVKPKQSIHTLRNLEAKLRADADELKLRGLSRKHRKRLLRRSRLGLSIVEEAQLLRQTLSTKSNNGEWLVEPTGTATEHKKQDKYTANKENEHKHKKDKKTNAPKRKINTGKDISDVSNKKPKVDNILNKNTKLVDNKNNKLVKNKKEKALNKGKTDSVTRDKKDKQKKKLKKDSRVTTKQNDEGKDKELKAKVNKDSPTKVVKDIKIKKSDRQHKVVAATQHSDRQHKVVAATQHSDTKQTKPTLLVNKVKNFQKQLPNKEKKDFVVKKPVYETPKKVKFELKNNCMQKPIDYYKSIRQSPNIPFDSSKRPAKTNLKPSTPSPINPFFKKKLKMKH